MSAAVPVFAWLPRLIEGRALWLRTFYRVYRGGGVSNARSVPGDAL